MTVTLDAPPTPCRGKYRLYDLAQHTTCANAADVWHKPRRVRVLPARADDADVVRSVLEGRLPSRVLTVEERRDLVRALHAQGLIDQEIAARLDVSRSTAWKTRTALGLPPNGQRT
jgi:transcriptional regulator of acetoin/glycerol metabolism